MALIVHKYGGTSLADLDRINVVADRVKAATDAGDSVAVVVSAMAGTTDQLVTWVRATAPLHDAREYDTVAAAGEQITAGLLALALQSRGVTARSWLGWQIPLRTDGGHGRARIESIETDELHRRLARREVPVVAGFQGLGPLGRITTLGRGGTDTTAVALAAALGADRCDIFYRRGGRLHCRSAHRCDGAQAEQDHLRGDAGARLPRRQGLADSRRRDGDEAPGAASGRLQLFRFPWNIRG